MSFCCTDSEEYQDFWYILFVRTGQERAAARDLLKEFHEDEITPVLPQVQKFFKRYGEVNIVTEYMFPGYLIVETAIENEEFLWRVRGSIRESPYIIKILEYGDSENICVNDRDRAQIEQLLFGDQCIETSRGIIKGSQIVVTEGPLKGRERIIKKINRHRREAIIELEFMGNIREVKIGLEIVERMPMQPH
jgi:transcriptional antiterminator NusG